VLEWGISTEPWIFTVDRSGRIAASFDGVRGPDELDDALAAITP